MSVPSAKQKSNMEMVKYYESIIHKKSEPEQFTLRNIIKSLIQKINNDV